MAEIDREEIVEVVKKRADRAFKAFEKRDADALLDNYHNHVDFRFVGVIFGEIVNLTYDEFAKDVRRGFEGSRAQKFIREAEFVHVLSDELVLYNTTGTGYKVPIEGERIELDFIVTMLYSLREGTWKAIYETETQVVKKEELL